MNGLVVNRSMNISASVYNLYTSSPYLDVVEKSIKSLNNNETILKHIQRRLKRVTVTVYFVFMFTIINASALKLRSPAYLERPVDKSCAGGLHVIGLLDSHVAIACVPVVCALEIVASVYIYGVKKFKRDVHFMSGRPVTQFWLILWKYIIPITLSVITVYSLREVSSVGGWCVAMASVICIPIYAANEIYRTEGTFKERIYQSCQQSKDWGPTDPEIRERWKRFQSPEYDTTNIVLSLKNINE